jgi:aspartyl-tRNA(Asn)/glutamyl-tRNA(Gln) amidotransferase subunit A
VPELRLTGKRLAAVRSLAENPVTRAAVWRVASADFSVADLEALPDHLLAHVEELPEPIQGAPPRTWHDDGDLGPPPSERTTAADLRAAYAAGTTDPVEVLERVLDRAERGDVGAATFSPFVTTDPERARRAAEESAARWRSGAPRSVLDGVPVPVKDEFDMAGLATLGGTSWRTTPATDDAFVVARLREGGAVLPGKAHATEDGMNPLGYNANHDHPRNPYSSDHAAGGSSTGSGVAVSVGLAPVALSSDGGGSIRIPAAMTGVLGLKPTFNRLSRTGDLWRGSVEHAGPIGASTGDLVDLLDVAAGPDPADPLTRFAPDWDEVRDRWRDALGRGVRGCRIGVLADELADADPAIARACTDALEALAAEGAELVEVTVEQVAIANAIGPIVIAAESAANTETDIRAHRDETGDELRLAYALLEAIPTRLFLRASRARTALRRRVAAAIADVDVLALPAHARPAPRYPLRERGLEVADTAWTSAMTRFSFLANLTGLPAAAVPVGLHEGLPVALQVVGDAWDEASVLAVAAHLERIGVTALPLPGGHRSLLD